MALAAWLRLHSTNGGVSDTELNELAVSPTKVPSAVRAVTTVTPVANIPRAVRNSWREKVGVLAVVGARGIVSADTERGVVGRTVKSIAC